MSKISYMSARCIYRKKVGVKTKSGNSVSIYMDLFQLEPPFDPSFPEGYKFSWTAFDPLNPEDRVLFDCHIPKGAHYHIDGDLKGQSFDWKSLEESEVLFFEKVQAKFGEIPSIKELLK